MSGNFSTTKKYLFQYCHYIAKNTLHIFTVLTQAPESSFSLSYLYTPACYDGWGIFATSLVTQDLLCASMTSFDVKNSQDNVGHIETAWRGSLLAGHQSLKRCLRCFFPSFRGSLLFCQVPFLAFPNALGYLIPCLRSFLLPPPTKMVTLQILRTFFCKVCYCNINPILGPLLNTWLGSTA